MIPALNMSKHRVQKYRRAFYSLNNIGMNYPGLHNNSKSHFVYLPTLTYRMQCVNLSSPDKSTFKAAQGGIIKQMCELSKRSRHTNLLRPMNLDNDSTVIGNYTKPVFKRVYCKSSLTKYLWYQCLS